MMFTLCIAVRTAAQAAAQKRLEMEPDTGLKVFDIRRVFRSATEAPPPPGGVPTAPVLMSEVCSWYFSAMYSCAGCVLKFDRTRQTLPRFCDASVREKA